MISTFVTQLQTIRWCECPVNSHTTKCDHLSPVLDGSFPQFVPCLSHEKRLLYCNQDSRFGREKCFYQTSISFTTATSFKDFLVSFWLSIAHSFRKKDLTGDVALLIRTTVIQSAKQCILIMSRIRPKHLTWRETDIPDRASKTKEKPTLVCTDVGFYKIREAYSMLLDVNRKGT